MKVTVSISGTVKADYAINSCDMISHLLPNLLYHEISDIWKTLRALNLFVKMWDLKKILTWEVLQQWRRFDYFLKLLNRKFFLLD